MRDDHGIELRLLTAADLDGANAVIEAAIMTWQLPDRVKRLSLPSYRYSVNDQQHLTLVGAVDSRESIVGTVAWEPANVLDTPEGARGLLLHGIYVLPRIYGAGIGSRMLDGAIEAARVGGFDGLLVKANRDAQGFFAANGLQKLSMKDAEREYPYRFWRDLRAV